MKNIGNIDEKKKIKVEWIIIVVLSICLISTVSFIIYDKFIKEDTIVDSNNNGDNDKDDKKEDITITPEIETKVTDLTSFEHFTTIISDVYRNKNVFDSAYERLGYVTNGLRGRCMWTSGTGMQETPYVLYDTYREEYESIYGNLYNLDIDLQDEYAGLVASNNCANINPELADGGNYICWMGTMGISGSELKMELTDKKLDGNIYTLVGTYKVGINDFEEIFEIGSFELKYVIENNEAYLSSLVMTTDKEF